MYGTIFTMKVKRGKDAELIESFKKWDRERKPKVRGAVASFLLKSDKGAGQYFGVAVFKDKDSYRANAEDPEQDKWYRQLRELLQADPEWHDGEYLYSIIA